MTSGGAVAGAAAAAVLEQRLSVHSWHGTKVGGRKRHIHQRFCIAFIIPKWQSYIICLDRFEV
jgi:hypothetical protein